MNEVKYHGVENRLLLQKSTFSQNKNKLPSNFPFISNLKIFGCATKQDGCNFMVKICIKKVQCEFLCIGLGWLITA